jgi:hypothetical protein
MHLLIAAAAAAHFNYYPGFEAPGQRIDAIIDKGPIAELIVRCPVGTGIIVVSKYDGLFCAPDFTCFKTLKPAFAKTCR